ncbi:hypothetical protein Ahy_A08g041055 isoform G [Arachis hypogaea]|uniref:Uncharacterized protein n=1 Tax=Arachis hypogaea TaxID=3818 RepID=A0A445C1I6_ARAHY|nr:hypothetical protein Ahy_A08g041055 isoform G [Arachis hypogaea]
MKQASLFEFKLQSPPTLTLPNFGWEKKLNCTKVFFHLCIPHFLASKTLVVPFKQEDPPNVTPDSSTTVNSKSDHDNSMMMFQEMYMDIFKWKEQIDKQMMELSNTVYAPSEIEAIKPIRLREKQRTVE